MASKHTEHYGLSQWEKTDKVMMEDFNADNAKLDAALKAHDAALAGKATVAALNSLSSTVSGLSMGKANVSALNSVQSTVSSLSDALNRKGNCNVETFSYVGNGQSREEHPTVITFKKVPAAFLIFGRDALLVGAGCSSPCFFVASMGNITLGFCRGSWSGAKYSFNTDSSFPSQQANSSGETYTVIAFYTA